MRAAMRGRTSLERLHYTDDRLIVAARVFVLLAGFHMYAGATVADECRSCELSRGVPPELWQEFFASLQALDRFTLADEALARHLMESAGMGSGSAGGLIGDPTLQRFTYPWKPELLQHRFDYDEHSGADEEPQPTNTPPQPTWLSVPYPNNDDGAEDRTLTVSADEVRHKPALATQSRASGKWYWEVRYLPGTTNLPHAALVGIIDPAKTTSVHEPVQEMTALPLSSFAGLLGGEYVQFALDLDGQALHYGVNGNWNSDPEHTAFGFPIAGRTALSPAVVPHEPNRHPYIPDKFEFNFGGSKFRYPVPAGYRPYDISAAATTTSPERPGNAKVAHGAHERAFFAAIRAFDQPFDPITEGKLREAIESWRAYRDAACRLSAKFKKQKGSSADANCIREFGGALLAALPRLQHSHRLSFDPPFDELPPIDLEQHPKLHYVEINESNVPAASALFDDGRLTANVRITDTSGPLILFLRAYGGTHWRITVEPGVIVQHVFLFGQYEQTATVSGKVASIRGYSNEQHNSGKLWNVLHKGEAGPVSLAAALEELIGLPPTSLQKNCENARCEIAAGASNVATGDPK